LDWLLVAGVAPILLFPHTGLASLLLYFIIVLILQWWAWGEVFPLTPLNPAILLMAVMVGVSIFVTPDLVSSMGKITGVLLGILVFATVTRHSRTRAGWNSQLGLFILASIILAGIGALGTNWMTSKHTGLNAVIAMLPTHLISLPGAENGFNVNELAGALLWVVPVIGLAILTLLVNPRWFARRSGKGKLSRATLIAWIVWLGIAIIFCSGVLIITQSRDGYLAMAAAIPILFVALAQGKTRYLLMALLIVAVVVAIVILSHVDTQVVFNQLFGTLPAKGTTFSVTTMYGRIDIWNVAIQVIKDKPLTGIGMNAFRNAIHLLDPLFQNPARDVAHAHNEILQAALDLGIPGMVAFIALYAGTAGMLAKVINGRGAPRILAAGLLGGLLAHFLFGITDAVALGAKPAFLFWWLLALLCGLYLQSQTVKAVTA
jgi:putative inorganic carbon (HCO3(-)) transporter